MDFTLVFSFFKGKFHKNKVYCPVLLITEKFFCRFVDKHSVYGVESAISKGAVVPRGLQRLSLFPAKERRKGVGWLSFVPRPEGVQTGRRRSQIPHSFIHGGEAKWKLLQIISVPWCSMTR